MDKRYDDLTAVMNEVVRHRDKGLRDVEAFISPHRLQRLHAALASEFPVETAFQAASDTRDKSLMELPVLPRRIELFLHGRLLVRRTRWLRPAASQRLSASVQTFWAASRSPTRFAAALALIVATIAALHFASSGRNDGSGPSSHKTAHPHFAMQSGGKPASQGRLETRFLRKSGNELKLRVSAIELASLQPSLLTINRNLLVDHYDFDRGLPLDLPIRQMLSERDMTASP